MKKNVVPKKIEMMDLASALAEVEEKEKKKEPEGGLVKSKKHETAKSRAKQAKKEASTFSLVCQNQQFQQDPFGAINAHLAVVLKK